MLVKKRLAMSKRKAKREIVIMRRRRRKRNMAGKKWIIKEKNIIGIGILKKLFGSAPMDIVHLRRKIPVHRMKKLVIIQIWRT